MGTVYYNIMIDRMLEEAKNALTKGIECNVSDYNYGVLYGQYMLLLSLKKDSRSEEE